MADADMVVRVAKAKKLGALRWRHSEREAEQSASQDTATCFCHLFPWLIRCYQLLM